MKTDRRVVAALFLLSGATGLIYEIVWIRLFAITFGNTAQALSTVLSVYLGGLALGALAAGKFARRYAQRCLRLYGVAEIATGLYALATPWLIHSTQPLLAAFYGSGQGSLASVALVRALLCSVILIPATILMGATLPLLAGWAFASAPTEADRRVTALYTVNLAGASAGALLSGFALLPALGFAGTLWLGCALSVAVGIAALQAAPRQTEPARKTARTADEVRAPVVPVHMPARVAITVAFLSGWTCMLYEVAWGRIYGILLGPTASTITLILAAFLIGLTAGALWGARLQRNLMAWLCAAQFSCAGLLAWALLSVGAAPGWVADWVRVHSGDAGQIELMKVLLLSATLLPLTTAFGLIFPLILRIAPARGIPFASRIGGIYGINTAGCIVGSLAAGWLLIPAIGTERTLLLGAFVNLGLGVLLLHQARREWTKWVLLPAAAAILVVIFAMPRWNMGAMTAGAYKYAPYAGSDGMAQLDSGELVFLHEGITGTVVVRKQPGTLILSIDGKVDATDAGGDLLTEKLLAHVPLMLAGHASRVCLIGLASGVTAGAALTHPIESLDVIEVSRDVVQASHLFDAVNGKPLEDARTRLLLNDGRNHLALSSAQYDVIVSEPSNPWIAGMNSLFTRDFFRIAKRRLNRGGLFAQWFHIYNMPKDDLQSLLRAFQEVFPSAMLWELNDGDVLLTGFADESAGSPAAAIPKFSRVALADLKGAGVEDPSLLLDMYAMRGDDIRRFAEGGPPNTDDDPRLEFHGQRDLHAQTDFSNADALAGFPKALADPAAVLVVRERMTPEQRLMQARMFEHAESDRSAFRAYYAALHAIPGSIEASIEAVAGMDRTARLPGEHAAVALSLGLPAANDTPEGRTEWAIAKAKAGETDRARFLFEESVLARPQDAAARFNYGVFFLERKDYKSAVGLFGEAIRLDARYLPAYEALAESYLELGDWAKAVTWSRRILEIDPNHAVARQMLARLEHKAAAGGPEH